ncbi:MAG: porin family protein [Desulfobacteria bacterium]
MKKISLFTAILAVPSILLMAGTAVAEIRPGSWTLTPTVGGYTFEGNQNLETGPLFGLKAGYEWTEQVGVEGFLMSVPTTLKEPENQGVDLFHGRGEILYYLTPKSRLVPYLAGGLGLTKTIYPPGYKYRYTRRIAVDAGAGLKYGLSPLLALRADLRYLLLFGAHGQLENNIEYTAGLVFTFGGKP